MKLKIFFMLSALLTSAAALAAHGGGSSGVRRIEINGFYGLQNVSPGDVNDYINAQNATLTTKMSKITQSTVFGGEVLYNRNANFGLGVRYSSASATSGQGSVGSTTREVKTQLDDVGLVAKFRWPKGHFAFLFGLEGGVSTNAKLTDKSNSTSTDYTASNKFVGRGFLGARLNLGLLALFLEGGYASANLGEPTYNNTKLTVSGDPVAMDLSGPYGTAGIGFQF